MKSSNYNIFVHYEPDNVYLGFNSVSGGMYIFNQLQYDELNKIIENARNINENDFKGNPLLNKMVQGRFLIPENMDEVETLKLRCNSARYSQNSLGMVITSTLNCNFNCPYCYVDREKTVMSKESIGAIKNFFLKKLNTINYAVICWTGGEPLLALDVVEELNTFFVQESSKKKIDIKFNMITNGYLLTPEMVVRLKDSGIQTVQITLDGNKDDHDKMRATLGGHSTYEKVIKNVEHATKSNLKVILRSNIEKNNYDGIYKLIDDLADRDIDKNKIFFAPRMVMDIETRKGHYCGNCFSNKEFSHLQPEVVNYSFKKGFKVSKQILGPLSTFCGANTLSLHVIDSHANILKCYCNLGRAENNRIGYIKENGDVEITDYTTLTKWMSWDPFHIDQCKNCEVLPVCMGGCMYYNVIGDTDEIEIGCSHLKYNLREMMKTYYISATKGALNSDKIDLFGTGTESI